MTTRLQDSFFSISAEAEENSLSFTVHEEHLGHYSKTPILECKEKTRRRRGCGHPYRMRLNMVSADDDRELNSTHAPQKADYNSKADCNNKPVRERQGRHPYRRCLKSDNRQSMHNHHSVKPGQDDKHSPVHKDEIPRLGSSTAADNYQMSSETFSREDSFEKQRRPRNLFPYHQRARKKRYNEDGYQLQQGNRNQSQKKRNWQKRSSCEQGSDDNRYQQQAMHHDKHCRNRNMGNMQDQFLPTQSTSQEFVHSFSSSSSSDGTKVFYKKRRQTFSPSSRQANPAD